MPREALLSVVRWAIAFGFGVGFVDQLALNQ